jgi:phytoene/squalene synthetase
MKQIDLRNKFKKASKTFCLSTVVVSPDPLSCTQSTYSATKTTENMEENPDDPEPAAEGDIQMEFFPD